MSKKWLENINDLKRKFNLALENIVPYTLYKYIIFLHKKIKLKDEELPYKEEYFLKWRPFSREKYYIIRMEYQTYAHFAAAQEYIFAAEYVKTKGMHPIMALQWRCDLKNKNLYGENEWETIFRQQKIPEIENKNATILVSTVNAYDILNGHNIKLNINADSRDTRIHATEDNWRNYYRNAHRYVKKYWKFNQCVMDEVNKNFIKLFQNEKNILGVALREQFSEDYNILIKNTDVKKVYKNHPLGPNINEILDIVEEMINRWNCKKIFVATRFNDSITKFEERFPGKIIYCERKRVYMVEDIKKINSRRKFMDVSEGEDLTARKEAHRIAREYAQETILLSKCTYLIGAKSGQTIAALALNGGQYKDIKVLYDRNNIKYY